MYANDKKASWILWSNYYTKLCLGVNVFSETWNTSLKEWNEEATLIYKDLLVILNAVCIVRFSYMTFSGYTS